jgi:DNA polymerase-3 subunit gamma/tau
MVTTGSHYTVLARRFRPQAFDDVVGQEHVSRALTNAIRSGRVAHAYMFTGARGVGKTSTARILAKALNCPHAVDGVPCNQCEICDGISAGNDVDVLEIDGASNRGIDDIRSLRANVGVRSMRTQYKVYIIDEVHMLTKEAFNALLKTLEEPPPNVKFVFCTTEPNKVPDTILSRCQRFDFSSIDDVSIADRLREIAKAEGFEVAEDALELVARRARGSMRDSQSLFDQLLAFSDGSVSADDVHRMLGTAGDERLVELFDAMVEHRPGEVLSQLDGAFGMGVQPGELMDQSIGYVRDLMVGAAGGDSVPLCSVAGRFRETLQSQSRQLGMHSIMAAFQILADAKNQMFRSTFSRTVLEMAMVQVSLLENLTAISDLLSGRLPALPETSSMTSAPTAALEEKKKSESLIASSPRSSGQPQRQAFTVDEGDDHADSQLDEDDSESATDEEPDAIDIQPASIILPSMESDDLKSPSAAEAEASTSDDNIEVPPSEPVPLIHLSNETAQQLFLELQKSADRKVSAGMKLASGLTFTPPGRIEIQLEGQGEFARKVLEQPDHRARIESEIFRLTGQQVSMSVRLVAAEISKSPTTVTEIPKPSTKSEDRRDRQTGQSAANSASSKVPARETAPQRNLLGEIDPTRDGFVRQVMQTFGATVVKVTAAPSVQIAEESPTDS